MANKARTCIVGIDGATFDLIRPWADAGLLPNISRLMSAGASGVLISSVPDNSAPAWTSIVTGRNPGKHRVFGFTAPGSDIAKIKITNSRTRAAAPIWELFNRNGQKVCVINVPLTYPAEHVDGVMISGMDTPGTEVPYTYPESLKDELNDKFGRYRIEPEHATTWTLLSDRAKTAYIDEVHDIARLRCRVARHLMATRPWDFFMVVFVATDRIQHKFWEDMPDAGSTGPGQTGPSASGAVLETYRLIDSFVGEIAADLPEDATLAIVSDHGFGPRSRKVISVNRLLSTHGLLAYKNERQSVLTQKLRMAKGMLFDVFQKTLPPKQRHRLKKLLPFLSGKAFAYLNFANIDWSATSAYVDEPMGLVWINRKDRFDMGIVDGPAQYKQVQDRIISLLESVKDPQTHLPILQRVCRKQDVFEGPYLDEAPDIVFSYGEGYTFGENKPTSKLFEGDSFLAEVTDSRQLLQITGVHRPEGIFVLSGRNVMANSTTRQASVVDVLPTCLYLAGLEIPKDVDGRVLTEVVDSDFQAANAIKTAQSPADAVEEVKEARDSDVYSDQDQEKIEQRLRNLGYL